MPAHFAPILAAFDPLPSLVRGLPLAQSAAIEQVISPVLVIVLCLIAGVATVLLLPGRREASVRKIGGAILLAVLLIFGAVVGRKVGGLSFYFWVFSFIALAGAVRVVTHPRPVYSALYFVLTVFASAGLFVLLWAEFMAAALVLIYAGAILITYVFVIMLASQAAAPGSEAGTPDEGQTPGSVLAEYDTVSREPVVASALGFAMMALFLFVIFDQARTLPRAGRGDAAAAPTGLQYSGATQQLGEYLFSNHLMNLELAGLILTVAMVGAIIIARRRILSTEPAGPTSQEEMVAPATPIDDNPHSIPVYGTDNPRQKAYPEA